MAERRPSRTVLLANYFKARPNTWIDGRELSAVAGAYAWRTRASELRRSPYHLEIENRQRTVTTGPGEHYIVSEYRLVAPAECGQPGREPETSAPTLFPGGV